MWRLGLRNASAHLGRLLLTAVAVVLGVTFVAGSLVLTHTSQRVLDQQFRTATSGADLAVRRAVAFDSAMGVEVTRDPVPSSTIEKIRRVPGVAQVEPVARGQGLLTVDARPIVPSGPSLLESWSPAPFNPYPLRFGRAPAADDEIVLDLATAVAHKVGLGRTVGIQGVQDGMFRVVGLAGFGDGDGPPNSTLALVRLPVAQRLLHLGSGASDADIRTADGANVEAVRGRLTAALGAQYDVSSSRDVATASAAAAKTQVGYLQTLLLAMAAASLLVGAFLIANTFSMVVASRTREIAVLRAAGATGRQVLGSILVEALLIGTLASAAGAALGVAVAAGLRSLLAAFGTQLPNGPLAVDVATLAGSAHDRSSGHRPRSARPRPPRLSRVPAGRTAVICCTLGRGPCPGCRRSGRRPARWCGGGHGSPQRLRRIPRGRQRPRAHRAGARRAGDRGAPDAAARRTPRPSLDPGATRPRVGGTRPPAHVSDSHGAGDRPCADQLHVRARGIGQGLRRVRVPGDDQSGLRDRKQSERDARRRAHRRVRASRRPAAGGRRLPAAVRTLEGRRDDQRPDRCGPGHPARRHQPASRSGPAQRPRKRRDRARRTHRPGTPPRPRRHPSHDVRPHRATEPAHRRPPAGPGRRRAVHRLPHLARHLREELQRERRRQRLRQARRRRRLGGRRLGPARRASPTTRLWTSAIRAAPWPAACRRSTRSWEW